MMGDPLRLPPTSVAMVAVAVPVVDMVRLCRSRLATERSQGRDFQTREAVLTSIATVASSSIESAAADGEGMKS